MRRRLAHGRIRNSHHIRVETKIGARLLGTATEAAPRGRQLGNRLVVQSDRTTRERRGNGGSVGRRDEGAQNGRARNQESNGEIERTAW